MKVKRILSLFVVFMVVILFLGCTIVPPGEVGIKINQLGDNRGVQDLTMTTGAVGYVPGLSVVMKYPIYVQTAQWTESEHTGRKGRNDQIVFNTKEGLVVRGDISLSYQLEEAKVPAFYVKFRTDDLDVFTHGFLFNVARDAFNEIASSYSVEEIYGAEKGKFLDKVKEKVNSQIRPFGVVIQQFGFLGEIKLPETVKSAINAKIQAIQDAIKVENQIRESKAEAQKKIAAAEGTARSNALIASSITTQLIQWEQLQIQKKQIDRWNGALPYMMPGGNQSAFLFNVPNTNR